MDIGKNLGKDCLKIILDFVDDKSFLNFIITSKYKIDNYTQLKELKDKYIYNKIRHVQNKYIFTNISITEPLIDNIILPSKLEKIEFGDFNNKIINLKDLKKLKEINFDLNFTNLNLMNEIIEIKSLNSSLIKNLVYNFCANFLLNLKHILKNNVNKKDLFRDLRIMHYACELTINNLYLNKIIRCNNIMNLVQLIKRINYFDKYKSIYDLINMNEKFEINKKDKKLFKSFIKTLENINIIFRNNFEKITF